MVLDPPSTIFDSLLDTAHDSSCFATFSVPDMECTTALDEDHYDLAAELLEDLTRDHPAAATGRDTGCAAPDTGSSGADDQLQHFHQPDQPDKRQIKLNKGRESQKRSRDKQKVCLAGVQGCLFSLMPSELQDSELCTLKLAGTCCIPAVPAGEHSSRAGKFEERAARVPE